MAAEKDIKTIGVIMDGNRRYAKKNNLSTFEGHMLGYENAKKIIRWSADEKIDNLILYVFSTENWKRSTDEVSYLMNDIFAKFLSAGCLEIQNNGGSVHFIGDMSSVDKKLVEGMENVQTNNPSDPKIKVHLAFSYGGRQEILQAVNKALSSGLGKIDDNTFTSFLYTSGVPDPDLIIRTGGEKRLSNFLPWQSVYSELFFTNTYWPEFSQDEFKKIIAEYRERERRIGK